MELKLRPYQKEAVTSVHKCWDEGTNKLLVVQATGTGKTIEFSKIAHDQVKQNERVLILAHRDELLKQASDKIKKTTGIDTVLEKAESHAVDNNNYVPITVGSVQTLSRGKRIKEYPPDYFDTIIVDEAHHTMSNSYLNVLNYFEDAKVLGVTATPDRADKKSLARFYEALAYEYNLDKAIQDGYLSPIKAQMIPIKLDISKVKIQNGDYSEKEVGDTLKPYLKQIAKEMGKYCKNRKTIVFLPLIEISKQMCNLLNQQKGLKAVEVNGQSPDRKEILKDFENGKYNVICNSMLLTEGYDCPAIDCVVMLRPTKSRGLYCQALGRGTRLSPGKTELLVLDFLWLSEEHDLCRPSCLIAKDEEEAEAIDKIIEEEADGIGLEEAEQKAKEEVIEQRKRSLADKIKAASTRKPRTLDPIIYSQYIATDLLSYEPIFEWEKDDPTINQLKLLKDRGFDLKTIKTKGYASAIINSLIERGHENMATPKQIKVFNNYGIRENLDKLTFDEANRIIKLISSNGWKLPDSLKGYKIV